VREEGAERGDGLFGVIGRAEVESEQRRQRLPVQAVRDERQRGGAVVSAAYRASWSGARSPRKARTYLPMTCSF
jgi:hypothetical protein